MNRNQESLQNDEFYVFVNDELKKGNFVSFFGLF